jgi:hypothetical protein
MGKFESFNARLRDELLNGEVFYTMREAQIIIESWRHHYNQTACIARIQTTSLRGCSCQLSSRGRLRDADRLRRPRWRQCKLSTNIPPGPRNKGRSQGAIGGIAFHMMSAVACIFWFNRWHGLNN